MSGSLNSFTKQSYSGNVLKTVWICLLLLILQMLSGHLRGLTSCAPTEPLLSHGALAPKEKC